MAKQHHYFVFIETYLSQSVFNLTIFSYQLLWWRHAGLRKSQHLCYFLMPLSPGEEGENTEPLTSNITWAVFSKNFKVILFISITLVSPFPWILTEQWWLILIYQFSLSNALQWRSGCLFSFFTVGKVRSKEAKYPWPCDPVQSGPSAVPGWRFLPGSLQRLFAHGTRGAGEKAPHLFVTAHQK